MSNQMNAPAGGGNRNMIIAIVVGVVLLCCCCSIVALGWFYGDTIMEAFGTPSARLVPMLLMS